MKDQTDFFFFFIQINKKNDGSVIRVNSNVKKEKIHSSPLDLKMDTPIVFATKIINKKVVVLK